MNTIREYSKRGYAKMLQSLETKHQDEATLTTKIDTGMSV